MNELPLQISEQTGTLRATSAAKVREWTGQANGFSLPAAPHVCRYATPTCSEGCYAKKGRMAFPVVQRAYERNYKALLEAGSAEHMSKLLIDMLRRISFRIFRIHVSGDFFSAEYARAWSITCGKFSDRKFWTYTRIQEVATLTELAGVSNLAITLSCDRDNWKHMLKLSRRFPSFGLCYYSVGETPPSEVYAWGEAVPARKTSGLVVFVDHACRGKVDFTGTCPTERHRDRLSQEGACAACTRCFF